MQSSSKRLIRLQSGWFSLPFMSGAYCSRTTANQYIDNASQLQLMQSACWNWFPTQGTGAWVSTGASLATPMYIVEQGGANAGAVTVGYPWQNECTQVHAVNRFQFPSLLTGYNITGVRIWLESPGEVWRDFTLNSSYNVIDDVWYAPVTTIGGALNFRVSSTLQVPSFASSSPDMSITAQLLTDNSWNVVDVESWNPFSYWGLSRFNAGGWSYYDLSAATVTWINSNRTFYLHSNWTADYMPFYWLGRNVSTYTRHIRGLVIQVYCEF